jgi:uncharacterized protein
VRRRGLASAIAGGLAVLSMGASTPAVATGAAATANAAASSPSFDCARVRPGSMAEWVCEIPTLAALDRELARVYGQARQQATGAATRQLAAEQRGWIRGRDDCWKSDDVQRCLGDTYRRRTAELQVQHGLVPARRTSALVCTSGAGQDTSLVLRTYDTNPPAARLEPDPERAVLFGEPVASGTLYRGRNTTLREHQGVIELQQGFEAPWQRCRAEVPPR